MRSPNLKKKKKKKKGKKNKENGLSREMQMKKVIFVLRGM